MELLVILHEELRVLVGELTQARGRIKRRPLDAEFDVIDQPCNLLCVLVLDAALPDLLLQAVEPLTNSEERRRMVSLWSSFFALYRAGPATATLTWAASCRSCSLHRV
jgi:hypothetical protein